jgi:general secretion pathway protein A
MTFAFNDAEWRMTRLERLGLKEDPFKLSADPRYLYLGAEHLSIYKQLLNIISRRRGLGLVIGDMGMGKSSLARRLYDVHSAEPNMDVCYIHTAAFKSGMDAARQISTSLGVTPQRSFQRQMESIERKMADAYTAKRNVVILLDDAQLMDPSALEVIHRLYNFDYDAKVAQVLAFGQSEMSGLFDTNKAVNARVFARMILSPLALGSALQMVLFRLNVAGRNAPLIHDNAFELLYEKSQGVPREIIRLCNIAIDMLLQSTDSMITLAIAEEAVKQ